MRDLKNPLVELFHKVQRSKGFFEIPGECQHHGVFTGYCRLGALPMCPACAIEAEKEASMKRWMDERVASIKKHLGVPGRFEKSGFRDWIPPTESAQSVKAVVLQYLKDVQQNTKSWRPLILSGAPGTGKTHLLCALANNIASTGITAKYSTLHSMLSDIKSAYSDQSKSESGQIFRYIQFDFLAIDEIDVMRATDNDKALLFEVINGRYNELKPTAIATNQAPGELGKFVTERVMDRLIENAISLRCDWQSARAGA